jgi:lysophospholipase III
VKTILGDNLGVFVVNTLSARVEQRSMPSTAFLMPYKSFWKDDDVLIYSPDFNYTINDYERLFDDIDFPDGYQMRLDTQKLIEVCSELSHLIDPSR